MGCLLSVVHWQRDPPSSSNVNLGLFEIEGSYSEEVFFVSSNRMEQVYCCRKCRKHLFRGSNVDTEPHVADPTKQFVPGQVEGCTSHFLVEAEPWMNLEQHEGKLNCPNCDARFGSFVWAGAQCSCGAWVVPAIQVPKSRVDVRSVKSENVSI